MINPLRGSRILLSAAVAAVFVASPAVVKFDASGLGFFAGGAAFAQVPPDPIDPPPGVGGPIDPPTCVEDCGPTGGPIDPPECEVDCGPTGGPIDPPACEVDCGPTVDPIDPPIETCETTKEGCKPEPVSVPVQTGNDDDDEPVLIPTKLPKADDAPTKAEVLEFVAGLECKTACTAAVSENGDLKVTLKSAGPEGATVVTTVKLESDTLEVRVDWTTPHGENISFDPDPLPTYSPPQAQTIATDIIEGVPASFADVFGASATGSAITRPGDLFVDVLKSVGGELDWTHFAESVAQSLS